jgi:endonuclease I
MTPIIRRSALLFLLLASLFIISCSENSDPTDPVVDPPDNPGNIPEGYYDTVDDSTPANLRSTLHPVIDDHQRIPYTSTATDTWNVLELADQDPNNSSRILDVYMNESYPKYGAGNNDYNREHVWAKSYGFPKDGSSNYPYTDCHHLFLCNDSYNSSRGNKPFGTAGASGTERTTVANDGVGGGSGSYPGWSNWYDVTYWEVWVDRRGDIARAMFYMDVRYEGGTHGGSGYNEPDLILTDNLTLITNSNTGSNESTAYMGLLAVLLVWHTADPVDSKETVRNDAVYNAQGNRNPFIDHPEWVDCLFDEDCGN